MKLVHWPLMDGLLHLQPAQAYPRCITASVRAVWRLRRLDWYSKKPCSVVWEKRGAIWCHINITDIHTKANPTFETHTHTHYLII